MKNKIYNIRKSRLEVFELFGLMLNQILRSLFAKKVRIIAILFFSFCQITIAQNLDFVKNISSSDGTIQVADIALDGSGNVFVAGTYDALQSIDFDPGAGTGEPRFAVNFAQGSIKDIYVAKYDASGNFIWVMGIYQQVSQGLEFGGIEVDASGNCYIAGTVRGITSAMVLPVTGSNFQIGGANSLGSDYEAPFIIKVNSGGVKQWHVNPDVSTSSTRITGLSLSGSNVIVAGTYFNGSPIGLPTSTSPAVDSYAAAYSQSTGALLSSDRLVKSIASSTSDVDDMKIDASGNIFVTGIYKNNTSFGATDIDGGSSGRTYVAKYNISYVLQWVKNEYGRGQVLELANDGNVWIGRTDDINPAVIENWSSSGVKSGTSIDLTFVPNAMSIDSDDDIYVSAGNSASLNGDFNKYSGTDGAQIFAYDIGADAMVIDANDRLHLSDRYKTTTDFDLGAGTTSLGISDNDHDLFLFVYNNNNDATAPAPVTYDPLDNATGVSISNNLTLTFDEAIQLGTGSAILKNLSTNAIIPSASTVSESTLIINPSSSLVNGTPFYVEIASGVVQDLTGNNYAGFSGNTAWNFTTIDIMAPSTVTFVPIDNAINIGVSNNLTLTFNENIQLTGSAVLKNISGSIIPSASSVSGSTLTINPNSNLSNSTQYYVELASGVIQDLSGNSHTGFNGSTFWNFTTEAVADVAAPTVSSLLPLDNATGVAIEANLVVTFNENVQSISGGGIQIKLGSATTESFVLPHASVTISGSTITINPTNNFNYGSDYHIVFFNGAVEDIVGNNFAGFTDATTWNFTAEAAPDVTAPAPVTYVPADNATGVSVSNNFTLTFNEAIQLTGGAVLKNFAGSVIPSLSSVSGSTLTINPTSNLAGGIQYYIEIASGVIKDLADNSYAGFAGNSTWNFTSFGVVDATAPSPVTFVPTDNSTNISFSNNLTLTFDEAIQLTGGAVLKTLAGSVVPTSSSVSGSILTINPTSNLLNSTQYYVELANGVIQDLAGNSYAGFNGSVFWNFTTEAAISDITPPIVGSFLPLDNTTGVAIEANLVVTFNENMTPVSGGSIQIKTGSGGGVEFFLLPNAKVTFSGSTITINPTNDFNYSSDYYVVINNIGVQDIAENRFAGFTDAATWNFTTVAPADISAPVPVTYVPLDNAAGVSVSINLALTFNEAIQLTGGAVLKQTDGAIIPSSSTVSGSTLTINPTSNLVGTTQYYVEIASGVIKDLAGNSYAGFIGSTNWNFATASADVTAPSPVTFTPTDNATEVNISNNLTLAFDEHIRLTGEAVLKQAGGAIIPSSSTLLSTSTGGTLIINPTSNLVGSTQYYVEIASGIIKDFVGNSYTGFSGSSAWNFTTAAPDVTVPAPVTYTPLDNATGVSVSNNLTLTFDESITVTGEAVLKSLAGSIIPSSSTVSGSTLTINPTSSLVNNTQYYVEIASGVIKDIAGNSYAGFSGSTNWNFTTVDVAAPVLTTLTPNDGATDIALDATISVLFDEPIKVAISGATKQAVIKRANGSDFEVVALTSGNISGNTLTIPHANLEYGQAYYIYIGNAVIADLSNNWFGGITNSATWNFTTVSAPDVTAPAPVTYVPTDNATGVSISNNLTLAFDEAIQLTGGAILKQTGGAIIPSSSSVSGSTLTINPTSNLVGSTQYYVEIASGVIKDTAGNSYAGFTGSTNWNFTTVDVTAPVVTTLTPNDGATDVALDATISILFDEPIKLAISGATKIALIRRADASTFEAVTLTSANFSGNTLTIFHANLKPGVSYYINIANGVIADLAGNWFAGISNPTTWNFTAAGIADVTAPVVTTLTPNDEATNVALDATLSVLFDEPIRLGINGATKQVIIWRANVSQFETVALTSANVSGNTLTLPHTILEYGQGYYITFNDGVIVDLENNLFGGITNSATWNFTTVSAPDVTAPAPVTYTPTDNATGVSISNNLTVTFDEVIQLIGGAVLKQIDGAIIPSSSSVSGSTLTINPTSSLVNSTQYYVELASGVIKDLAGNNYAGFSGNSVWNFTTEKSDQTIAFSALSSKLYGGNKFSLTATSSSTLTVSYISSNLSVATISGAEVTIVGAGTTTITASQAGNSQFNAAPNLNQILEVNKASLTATADDKSKTYGDTNPGFSLSFTGFLNGDNSSVLDVLPPRNTTAVAASNAGEYDIIVSGGSDNNYNYNYVSGKLTINKATLIVTADDKVKIFGTDNPSLSLSYGGFLNGDNAASISEPTANTIVNASSDVGAYAISLENGSATNYSLTLNSGTLTITQKAITITADAKPKAYGVSDPAFTYQTTSGSLEIGDNFTGSLGRAAGEDVNTYAINVGTVKAGGNYNLSFVGADLTISKATITATAVNISRQFNTANPIFTISYTGLKNGETKAVINTEPTAATAASLTTPVGTAPITLSGGSDNNYNITLVNGTLTITEKAIPVFTFIDLAKTYGDAVFDLAATSNSTGTITYSIVGEANGTTLSVSNNQTVTIGNAGNISIKATVAESSIHEASSKTILLVVSQRAVTITANGLSKVYGAADPILKHQTTSGSLKAGDSFTGDLARVVGEDVNTYAINVGTVTAGANYNLSYEGSDLTITQKAVAVTADAKSKLYGVSDPVLTYQTTAGSLETGDSFTGDLVRVAGEDVNTYVINVGAVSAGGNYNLSYVGANLTITQKAITVTADAKSKVYGTSDPALTYQTTSGSLETGDSFTGILAKAVGEDVNTYAINVGTVTAGDNYNVSFVSADLTITQKAITITADGKSKVYGDADPSLTYQVSNGSLETGDSFTGNLARVAGEAVNAYVINAATLTAGANYNVSYQTADLTITKATITATADDKSRGFGVANPTFTISYTGFKNGETSTVIDTEPTASTAADETTAVGTATITLSVGSDNNYNFTLVNGILTIAEKTVATITFADIAKTYGDVGFDLAATTTSTGIITYSIVGEANGSTLSGTDNQKVSIGNAGTVLIKATVAATADHETSSKTVTLTIAKKAITVTADAKSKVYGDLDPSFTYQITAGTLEIGDNFTGNLARVVGEDVNTYAINVATVTAGANYIVDYQTADLTISKATITATADDKSRDFGVANPTFTISYTGLKNGESNAVIDNEPTASTTAITATVAGIAAITLTGGSDNNYNITLVSGTLTIVETKQDQTITFDVITNKVFGDAAFDLSSTASSNLVVTYSVVSGNAIIENSTVTISGAGTVTIVANQSGDASFHAAGEQSQSFTIAKANQVISITAIDAKLPQDAAFDVVATTDSGLDLSYAATGPATISGTSITLTGVVGEVIVTVSQVGNNNYNAASATASFMVDLATGIADELASVSIYPNPVSNWLNIASETLAELNYAIYSQNGKLMDSGAVNRNSSNIDVRKYEAGLYLLKIISQQHATTTKILINR